MKANHLDVLCVGSYDSGKTDCQVPCRRQLALDGGLLQYPVKSRRHHTSFNRSRSFTALSDELYTPL